jgi:hypothetical protein
MTKLLNKNSKKHASQNYVITSLNNSGHDIKVNIKVKISQYPTGFYINGENFDIFGFSVNGKLLRNWCLFTFLQKMYSRSISWPTSERNDNKWTAVDLSSCHNTNDENAFD